MYSKWSSILIKVPWKSSNSQDESKKAIQVPVQATMLSLYSFVFTIIMLKFIDIYMTNNQFPLIIVAITLLFTSTQLPLILALTIKHSKKQKPKPNIPNKPMFYDNHDSDDHGTEMMNVVCKKSIHKSFSLNDLTDAGGSIQKTFSLNDLTDGLVIATAALTDELRNDCSFSCPNFQNINI